jgi:hypothetical protein
MAKRGIAVLNKINRLQKSGENFIAQLSGDLSRRDQAA